MQGVLDQRDLISLQTKFIGGYELIAQWLIRLTDNQRNWRFGLCFLYLRNVMGLTFNYKRVCRIYRQLELNLRIKPKKRLVREPDPPAIPSAINRVWSMDFMHDGCKAAFISVV